MRQTNRHLLLSSVALAACLVFGSVAGAATPDAKPAEEKAATFGARDVKSFAGAFLAARTADVDHDYPTAIALYRKALDFEPANLEIRERLMISLLLNGDFADGLKEAEALKSDTAVERVTKIVRGLDALRSGKYDSARKILAYEGPNDLDRLTHLLLSGWADVGAGKGKKAIATINGLKGPAWFKVFTDYHLGAMAIVAGDTSTARQYLNRAVTNNDAVATAPDTFMRAVMALARLEASAGNKQKALDAISVGDGMISNYAPLKALRQSIEKGEKPAQQVTTAAEGAAGVLFSIGGALNRQGAEDMVALYLQISHALDEKSADTLIMLGGIAEKLEQPQRAIAFYQQVPEDSPMRRISELQLGITLSDTGKIDEAKSHLKELIQSDPADIRSYIAYGSVLSEAKDYKEMAANYDKAVEVIGSVPRQSDWSVFFQRGIAYERLKEWPKAEPNFRKALELNPEQAQVLNYLGYSLVDMNLNLDEGLKMIQAAVDARPDDGYIVDSLGWAYYRLGRFDDAVTELEKAIQLRAGDATINDHLGDAYWRVGRKLEAVYQWNRTLVSEGEDVNREHVKQKIENGLPALDPNATNTVRNQTETPAQAAPAPATPDKKS
ncbi:MULTISPECIES: tetratricopeptide repeat protein [Rhizobiaceae]|uniref:Tetratricopeptide (TPR) repeat protein n=1 Tax=Aliirhizobium cellulosilyticum TaxID=393664 RepID=A0A7W6UXZ4_9HYPH|nr:MULTISPECIES: tetratricopeptide repeat protein [Rhizobium/Agrobacterium group]MBB4348500.1 tetratricopeptide (TPR) repeat protein [Rhizobium cellulosilyticum]MBB4411736.1 tetratricopeptide (TPR) repeat protein [Rhizobium cellulosilyticum]MBB4446427.1 tetratricopeptide (TPR) repeat protein [Rhizobium cellulosilyticum]MBO0140436.1 tetratricopeptide repeat protein [Agrobacterium sp. Ap1]